LEYRQARAEFMSQVGLVLYDFNKFEKSSKWQVEAYKLKKYVHPTLIRLDSEAETQSLANYARRLAQVVQFDNTASSQIINEVFKSLDDSLVMFRQYGNFRGLATNLDVKALLEIRDKGEPTSKVQQYAEEALQIEPSIGNAWVQASQHFNLGTSLAAEFARTKRPSTKKKAIEEIRKVCNILSLTDIRLEPHPHGGTVKPDNELSKLGYDNAINIPPPRGVLPFTNYQLQTVLRLAISGNSTPEAKPTSWQPPAMEWILPLRPSGGC
jgi:hypothetical protein